MLQLKNISKKYVTGNFCQTALNDVNVSFRDSEFVAILGPSGSGKTTLLNMIGGLDHADSGKIVVDGVSTEKYRERDWDGYRNHQIGFIFQSYHLIAHQSILKNVELALTIGGVSSQKRRELAKQALIKVGLDKQFHKKPHQLSGGQMQRVAVARALVNDPKILLADEPTGALDSETGVQVMELLKEVASDRLVIMVTHNEELAKEYATRIVELKDGEIRSDSDPYQTVKEESVLPRKREKAKMGLLTSLSLSFDNLKTKKGRTFLTSLAGSIGIIGIALILALSSGVNRYITDLQKETMSAYPIEIEEKSYDFTQMMAGSIQAGVIKEEKVLEDKVYADHSTLKNSAQMSMSMTQNNLTLFKNYLDDPTSEIHTYVGENGIDYAYDISFLAWTKNEAGELISGNALSEELPFGSQGANVGGNVSVVTSAPSMADAFSAIPSNQNEVVSPVVRQNYDLLQGRWAADEAEVMLFLDENNAVDTQLLYLLGCVSLESYREIYATIKEGENGKELKFNYEELIGKEILLLPTCESYCERENGTFVKVKEGEEGFENVLEKALSLKIVGVAKKNKDAKSELIHSSIGYTSALTKRLIDRTNESDVVVNQRADEAVNVLTGAPFQGRESLQKNYAAFGVTDLDAPSSIRIYTDSFEQKEGVASCILAYNEGVEKEDRITYTDYVELMTSSLTTVINVITYVLVAFVAVSLVVSGLMIGIITRISVLERTKEIGILRSLGASKRNISEVFNAENILIGFFAGLIGVGITFLLTIPINAILAMFLGSGAVSAALPLPYALVLVLISTAVTLCGGLAPARRASKKDPVLALRTE